MDHAHTIPHRDTSALLDSWRGRLFGDAGELRDQLRGEAA